jgi:hypothetical protein
MSQGFGVDIYGIPFYGYSQPIDYSVTPFTATQADYGEITLSWNAPNATSWKYMQLVRSQYGYPTTPLDGTLLQQFTPSTIQKSYDDTGLTPGLIYYYAIFLSAEAPAWNSGTTYPANYQVLYNGQYWTSLQASNTNNTPVQGGVWWATGPYVPTWNPAGYAANLALANEGYGNQLYNRTPQPYKIAGSDTFGNTAVDNPSLQNYLNVLGFGLDTLKNRYDSFLNLNNPDVVSATDLDILGQQLGLATDYMATPQQRRQRVKTATTNYQLRGEPQSIHNLVAQLTGWDSTITETSNLYVSADQANFLHPLNPTWNANTTYQVNALVQYGNYNYKCLVQATGTAQAPTGTNSSNTWWQVQIQTFDTTTLYNPTTTHYSTWAASSTIAVTYNGIATGLPNPSVPGNNTMNALAAVPNSAQPGLTFYSASSITTPTWTNGTNYVINNYVVLNSIYYQCVKASGPATTAGAITPGTNEAYWRPFQYSAPLVTDQPNYIKDGAPLIQPVSWGSTISYVAGQQVQYQGILYQAALNHINQQPSGYYYSTKYWICIGPVQQMLNVSAYLAKSTNAQGASTASSSVLFYDGSVNQARNVIQGGGNVFAIGVGLTARFQNDVASLGQTSEPALLNYSLANSSAWAQTPLTNGAWYTKYGMAAANQSIVGTTTYSYALLNNGGVGAQQGLYCVTFANDFVDTAHKTHGIVFAWVDANNFWYATRTTLWKVVAGVETSMATWSRLKTGDRMVVLVAANNVVFVYAYARDGLGTWIPLNPGGTTGPTSGNQFGLIQKYSATGAL